MRSVFNNFFIVSALFVILLSCGGGGDEPTPVPEPPVAATLIAPANNEACLNGVSVNSTQSTVTFSWSASKNTDSYSVVVKNLNSSQSTTYNTTAVDIDITLTKGEPYSWHVISKSGAVSQTAESSTWKFYLAGDGIVSYAPFPAGIVHPVPGSTVNGTSTYLQWQGSDVDNDIVSYEVFLDETDATTSKGTTASTKLENVAVSSGKTYYWKVITTDSEGNTSDSGVFTFKVN